ncbi:Hypothetical protein I595_1811 [Croceitalea dokdonensis DOKDO 023]|uniref:Uncharacterized protein n=1 Tax=Croceitalea dokdonensis DOKDO 023 TaxID=1300341 RepID=A0A0P7AW36_9FLAO|nr:hypothetical protein [Croceitalea dokdonensis]KPM32162.1 Hypothetical protein I595_1811 [Croceitalea dokdonensis DOKDO 023]
MRKKKKYPTVLDEKEEIDLRNATDRTDAKKLSFLVFVAALLLTLFIALIVVLF